MTRPTPARPRRICAKCDRTESYKGLCSMHLREANQAAGAPGPVAKRQLTEDEVREIRRLSAEGVNRWDLAFKYDVAPGTITAIKSRRAWADID